MGQAMSCLSSPPASLFFFARHVMPLVGSGTLSRVPITVPGSIRQNMLCVSSLKAAVGSSRLEHSFLVVPAILHSHRKHELGAAQKNPGKVLKISVTRRFRAHFVCTRHRPAVSPSFCAVHVNHARSGY